MMALARARGKTLVETYVDGEFITHPSMPAEEAERTYARRRWRSASG